MNDVTSAAGLPASPARVVGLGSVRGPADSAADNERASARLTASLKLLRDALDPQRRVIHAGETIYRAGDRFTHLHVLHSGFTKLVSSSDDGREQVVGLSFRGDWLDFDGIASGYFGCDAIAMDTSAVWTFRYDEVIAAEIGNCLGMTLEAVSRARSRLARGKVITFPEKGRRDIRISSLDALTGFMAHCLAPAPEVR